MSNDRIFKDDEVITKLIKTNPKREGTKAAEQWANYRTGMTVAQARKVGIRPANLRWDIAHEWISVGKAKAKNPTEKKVSKKKAAPKKTEESNVVNMPVALQS